MCPGTPCALAWAVFGLSYVFMNANAAVWLASYPDGAVSDRRPTRCKRILQCTPEFVNTLVDARGQEFVEEHLFEYNQKHRKANQSKYAPGTVQIHGLALTTSDRIICYEDESSAVTEFTDVMRCYYGWPLDWYALSIASVSPLLHNKTIWTRRGGYIDGKSRPCALDVLQAPLFPINWEDVGSAELLFEGASQTTAGVLTSWGIDGVVPLVFLPRIPRGRT